MFYPTLVGKCCHCKCQYYFGSAGHNELMHIYVLSFATKNIIFHNSELYFATWRHWECPLLVGVYPRHCTKLWNFLADFWAFSAFWEQRSKKLWFDYDPSLLLYEPVTLGWMLRCCCKCCRWVNIVKSTFSRLLVWHRHSVKMEICRNEGIKRLLGLVWSLQIRP